MPSEWMPPICQVEDCLREARAKGLCGKHYQRAKNHGSVEDPRPSVSERFWSKVDKRGYDECWPWTGARDGHNYGVFALDGRNLASHRLLYQWLNGPVPRGKMLDHTCHNRDATCPGGKACEHRACTNPGHLEPVTNQQNQQRARARYCAAVGGVDALGVDSLAVH